MIELSTVLKQSTGQVSCNLNDEVAILNLDTVPPDAVIKEMLAEPDIKSAQVVQL